MKKLLLNLHEIIGQHMNNVAETVMVKATDLKNSLEKFLQKNIEHIKQIDWETYIESKASEIKIYISKRPHIALSLGILIVLIPSLFFIFRPKEIEAAWFSPDWKYRKAITINYTGTVELPNYQVKIANAGLNTLYDNGKLNIDASDLRFTDLQGNLLSYWVEEKGTYDDKVNVADTDLNVWVKVPSVQVGTTTIYMYYGNTEALPYSNADDTFEFADEFPGTALNTSKWTTNTMAGTSVSYGYLTFKSAGQDLLGSSYTSSDNYITRFKIAPTNLTGDFDSGIAFTTDATSYTNIYILHTDVLNTAVAIFKAASSAATFTTTYLGSTNFQIFEFTKANTKYGYWEDKNETASLADTAYTTPRMIIYSDQNSSNNLGYMDYVLVRKYAETAPDTPSLGSEEKSEKPLVYLSFDDEGTTTKTYTRSGWYNSSWTYRLKVTVDATKVDADLTDYPVYINLADLPTGFHSSCNQTDAGDIRVTTSDGTTEIPREVVFYNSTSDTGELYFKGNVDGDTDTSFYIYYGNSSASDYGDTDTYGRDNVWDSNYVGVWHLSETSGNHNDSSGEGNASNSVSVTQQGANIGKVYGADEFNGTSNLVAIPDATELKPANDMTIEAWAYLTASPTTRGAQAYVVTKQGASAYNFTLRVNSTNDSIWFDWANTTPTTYYAGTNYGLSQSTWYYIAGIKNGSATNIYVNGSNSNTTSGSPTGTNYVGTSPLRFGSSGYDRYFPGYIDEIRMSSSARSAAWVGATYNNLNSSSTFYDVDDQETGSISIPVSIEGVKGYSLQLDGSGDYYKELYTVNSTFGTGADGDLTINTSKKIDTDTLLPTRSQPDGIEYVVSSISTNTITTASAPTGIVAGDEIMLMTTLGSLSNPNTVGNYEFLTVKSISDATITTKTNVTGTYGNSSGNSDLTSLKVKIQRVPNYRDVTIEAAGTLTANSFNASTGLGGFVVFRSSGTLTVTGSIDVSSLGYTGGIGGTANADSGDTTRGKPGGSIFSHSGTSGMGGITTGSGYAGIFSGGGGGGNSATSYAGGAGSTVYGAGGGGGGGASARTNTTYNGYGGGGGGGGYGTPGTGGSPTAITSGAMGTITESGKGGTGAIIGSARNAGSGGGGTSNYGDSTLAKVFLGAGGGGGGTARGSSGTYYKGGDGGKGGGAVIIIGKTINITGTITSAGGAGTAAGNVGGSGGGGAGGSIKIQGYDVTTGSTSITIPGGSGNTAGIDGGNGGEGRAAVYYTTTYAGASSSSTYYVAQSGDTEDTTIAEHPLKDLSDEFSISLWFRQTGAISETKYLLSHYDNFAGFKMYMKSTGEVCVGIDDDSTWSPDDEACTSTTYKDSEWHNAIAVLNTTTDTLKIYIDGTEKGSDGTISANSSLANTAPLLVGIDSDEASGPWQGQIDELKIYEIALTAAQIKQEYVNFGASLKIGDESLLPSININDGLLGYWRFDEGSGDAHDSSGNNQTLTNNGAFYASAQDESPKYGDSVVFYSPNEYLSSSSSIAGIKTVSFWVYPKESDTNYFLDLNRSAYITTSSGTLTATGFTDAKIYIDGVESNTLVRDEWHHVIVTTQTAISASAPYVGRVGSNYGDFRMDELRFYSKYINENAAEDLYHLGASEVLSLDFNEGSGYTLNDKSGNGLNATTYSATHLTSGTAALGWTALGRYLNAIDFDGAYGYGTISDTSDSPIDLGYRDMSISAWIRPDSISKDMMIVSKGVSGYSLRVGNGRASFGPATTANSLTSTSGINAVYFYDTTQDSISQSWRYASTKSWFTESLGSAANCLITAPTDDRCGTKYFPKRASIVGIDNKLIIIDADNQTPWMTFFQGTNYALGADANNDISSVFALNGVVYVGTNGSSGTGLYVIDFVNDTVKRYNSTDDYVSGSTISGRNTTNTYSTSSGSPIINSLVNDVYTIELSGTTYIGVATDSGISIINKSTGIAYDFSDNSGDDYNAVWLDNNANIWAINETTAALEKWNSDVDSTADEITGTPDIALDETTTPAIINTGSAPTIPTAAPDQLFGTNGTSLVDGSSATLYFAHSNGIAVLNTNNSDETKGSVKYITKDYVTEHMSGNIAGYWGFNSNPTSDLEDLSKKGENLTDAGSVTFTSAGIRENAASFNGSSQYLYCLDADCGGTSNMDLVSTNFSTSFWVKTTEAPAAGDRIMNKGSSSGFDVYFAATTGTIKLQLNATDEITSVGSVPVNEWTHVTVTFNDTSNTAKIYFNGVLDNTDTGATTTVSDATYPLCIGGVGASDTTCTANLVGYLDDVMITRDELSAAQVQQLYDNGRRSYLAGATGTKNLATTTNTFQSVGAAPISNNGITNGSSEMMYVGNNSEGIVQYDLSSDTYVYKYTASSTPNLTSAGVQSLSLINAWTFVAGIDGTSDGVSQLYDVSGDVDIPTNQWTYVEAVRDMNNGKIKMYQNGSLVGESLYSGYPYENNNSLRIGAYEIGNYSTAIFDGKIDNLKIFNYAPTNYQVTHRSSTTGVSMGKAISSSGRDIGSGKILHLKFDEGYGSTTYNAQSSSNNSGTITGATWDANGKYGKSLIFSGSENYVSVDSISLSNQYSVSLWFLKKGTISENNYLISQYAASGYKLYMQSNGTVCAGIDDDETWSPDDSACSTKAYNDNQWHYLNMVVDQEYGDLKLYVDGRLVATDTTLASTGDINGSRLVYIGINNDAETGTWKGNIDDVKIYSFSLTSREIALDYNQGALLSVGKNIQDIQNSAKDGLIAYWKMDDSSGSATDSSGNSYTLTNNGTVTYSSSANFGLAASMSAPSSQYLSTTTQIPNIKTVSFWINPASTTNYFMSLGTYTISATSGTVSTQNFNSPRIFVDGVETSTIVAGSWQQVVITTTEAITASSVNIGKVGSNYFSGKIDDVRLYNRTLSPKDILDNFNAGLPPVGHWDLESFTNDIALDKSGNGTNGSIYAGTITQVETGIFGKSLKFQEAALRMMNLNKYVRTLSFWINNKSDTDSVIAVISSPSISIYGSTGGYTVTGGPPSKFYIDGMERTVSGLGWHYITVTFEQPILAGYISIGRDSMFHITGLVDDIRIYDYARDERQILQDMHGDQNSVHSIGFWSFDEGQGQIINSSHNDRLKILDSTIKGTLGGDSSTTTGDPDWQTTETNCAKGRCLDFVSANSDYISIGDTSRNVKSVSMWVKPDSTSEYLLDLDGGTHYIRINSGAVTATGFDSPTIYVNGARGNNVPSGEWSHIVVTTKTAIDAKKMSIGKVNANYYNGLMDEVGIYSYTLDIYEAKEVYGQGALLFR